MLELADRFEITGFVNEVAEAIGSENYLDELNDDDVIRLVVIIDRIQVESVAARKKLIERLSREDFLLNLYYSQLLLYRTGWD